GGASTEIMRIKSKPFKILCSVSLPMGSVRASDWVESGDLLSQLRHAWAGSGADEYKCNPAIVVAGTMTSLAAMELGLSKYESEQIDGRAIQFSKLSEFTNKLESLSSDDLLDHYPFLGKRAKSIYGGTKIALFVGERLGLKEIQISSYGLRYGTVIDG